MVVLFVEIGRDSAVANVELKYRLAQCDVSNQAWELGTGPRRLRTFEIFPTQLFDVVDFPAEHTELILTPREDPARSGQDVGLVLICNDLLNRTFFGRQSLCQLRCWPDKLRRVMKPSLRRHTTLAVLVRAPCIDFTTLE